MSAQGAVRDRCRMGRVATGTGTRPWCLAHGLPWGHATPQAGDAGADPADRPLPSDDEIQYAGRIAGADRPGTDRDGRVRAAVADLRSDTPDQRDAGHRALRRLRAEHAATAAVGNIEVELLLVAACATCGRDAARDLRIDGDTAILTRWAHLLRAADADHPVTTVRVDR